MADSDDDKVGYGRPPKKHQFKPGQSGNPKGPNKGSRSVGSEIDRMLRRTVTLKFEGRSRKMSVLQATLLQLGVQAAKGSLKAGQDVLHLASQRAAAGAASAEIGLGSEEMEILKRYEQDVVARHEAQQKRGRGKKAAQGRRG